MTNEELITCQCCGEEYELSTKLEIEEGAIDICPYCWAED